MIKKTIVFALVLLVPTTSFAQISAEQNRSERTTIYDVSQRQLSAIFESTRSGVQDSCESARSMGENDADDRHGTAGWMLGGVGCGVGLGLIGTGIIAVGSALSNPRPDSIPSNVDEDCYRDGYRSKSKSKNMITALLGGAIGTGVWLAIYSMSNR